MWVKSKIKWSRNRNEKVILYLTISWVVVLRCLIHTFILFGLKAHRIKQITRIWIHIIMKLQCTGNCNCEMLFELYLAPHKLCAVMCCWALYSQKTCSIFQFAYYMYMMLQIKRNKNRNLSIFQSSNRANMVDSLKQGWAMLDHEISFLQSSELSLIMTIKTDLHFLRLGSEHGVPKC